MSTRFRTLAWWLLSLLLASRLAAMALIPLTDDTEARYGEVARKMAENGNWITPMGLHGPFWAKPPLSTWVSAISMKWFGVSAFTARLPNLLLMILVIWMVAAFVAQKHDKNSGLLAALIAASMLLVYVTAGTVMTDTTLVFATTWGLFSFWKARETGRSSWGYSLFAALGVGLLAKGPVAIALTAMPIFFWALWQRDFKKSIKCLPWTGGILLMLAIALPWYLAAEHRTPGFLRYFLVGENFERFINPAWHGDKYGSAHLNPYGTIWVFWLAAALPWSFVAIGWLFKAKGKGIKQQFGQHQGLMRYLLLAAFMPEIFFSFCQNIISTYPLVGLPPLAALMAIIICNRQPVSARRWPLPSLAVITLALGIVATLLFTLEPLNAQPKQSQQPVVNAWQRLRPTPTTPLAYYDHEYYSAYFYSHGQIKVLDNPPALTNYLDQHPHGFVVFHRKQFEKLLASTQKRMLLIRHFPYVSLYKAIPSPVETNK